jgi:hypothetical protein
MTSNTDKDACMAATKDESRGPIVASSSNAEAIAIENEGRFQLQLSRSIVWALESLIPEVR